MPISSAQVGKLLADWGQGDQDAREALIPLVYDELRRLARRYLRRERPDHTLQSAALVHEAYLRMVHQEPLRWQNRAHFFGVAAQMMRHILVDHARGRLAAKRGAGAPRLTLDAQIALPQKREVDLVALDDALNQLAALDPQQGRLVELRFFGGAFRRGGVDCARHFAGDLEARMGNCPGLATARNEKQGCD